jgi:transcriptional regulator with GAF, ATPase, and Fis domain
MPSLKWMAPQGRPRVFGIYKRVTSIGRAGANDVAIESDSLEAHHAQVVFDGRDFSVTAVDAGATLQVNGKKKKKSKIFHNDKLKLGDVDLVFSLYDESSTSRDSDAEGSPSHTSEIEGMMKLSDFNRRLLEIREIPEQIETLLDAVIDVVHANKGFVILLRDGDPEIAAARNVDRETIPDAVTQLSDSILKRCIDTRQPLIVSDAVNDTMFNSSESVLDLQLSSVMVAPLIAQTQLLGLIYVGNDNVVNLFEQSSLEVLTVFAGQASLILQNAILLNQLTTDRDRIAEELEAQKFGDIIGSCPSLQEVFRRVEKVAPADINVLITGETGTGKELFARELHRRSNRAEGPFVVVNCGAIPENLMESELFGHVRGAFTGAVSTRQGSFQAADGGTLFLDEIGEMPPALQVKLLRALQERVIVKVGDTKQQSVDIRVLAATNADLEASIKEGTFREDLYYRLNVVNLHLPPLRERGDDVAILAKFLLNKYVTEFGATVKGFTPKALEAMQSYNWPGNVRQLENRIKKAIVLADKTLIGADDLDLGGDSGRAVVPLTQAREDFTRKYILEVLERNGGNRTRTARELGVDPRTVFRYLERDPDAPEPGRPAGG